VKRRRLGGTLGPTALVALAAATPAAAAPAPPLDHVGRWLTDANGRVVILHGFNMVNKVGGYRPEDTGFGADDARFLHRNGFNTIRLGIIYQGLEPNPPGADGSPDYHRGYLRSIARTERVLAKRKRTIAAIRDVDRRTLAFYEPNPLFNSSAQTSHGDTGDRHAAFGFHVYCLAGAGGFTSPVCAINEGTVFDNADDHIERVGDASLVTEFGASDDLVDTRRVIDLADEHMVGWQYWHYCDCDDPTTSGPGVQSLVVDPSKPPRGDNVKRAKLRLLARPYPQAVAGTPRSFSFDPDTRAFELAYSTASPDGGRLPRRLETEVRIPSVNYPDGYAAEAEGAGVTSRRDAPVLRLKRGRSATEVRVTVGPSLS
jgi:Glycoside hydrolase family 5 C-terminal domain